MLERSEGKKLENLATELEASLAGLEASLGALRYVPLIPLLADIYEIINPDDHVISGALSLSSCNFFVPNQECLMKSISSGRVILFFSVEIDGMRLYHPAAPALWRLRSIEGKKAPWFSSLTIQKPPKKPGEGEDTEEQAE